MAGAELNFGKNWKPKTIGLVLKHHDSHAKQLAVRLGKELLDQSINVAVPGERNGLVSSLKKESDLSQTTLNRRIKTVSKQKMANACDMIIVVGGDGTFLSIAREMKSRSVPIMGVNMGRVGFLTEIKKEEALEILRRILIEKKTTISRRALLDVKLKRNGKIIYSGPVVNDAVISKGAIARIISLQVSVNRRWANTVRADGLIFSTPTGSTAYNLAAGGPILDPRLPGILITPVSPHSLTQRPIVVPENSLIEVRLENRRGEAFLTLDGQDAVRLKENDIVTIKHFVKHPLLIVTSPTRDYFSLVREKFQFGSKV